MSTRTAEPRAVRALALRNPIAVVGIFTIGFVAMIAPELVLLLAIVQGAAPAIEAIRDGATIPFPVMAATLATRQALLLVGSVAVAAIAVGARRRASPPVDPGDVPPRPTPRVRAELGFSSARPAAIVAGTAGVVGLGPASDLAVRALRALAPDLEMGVLEQITQIAAEEPAWVLFPLLALLPGLAEETYFRGLVQGTFGRGWPAMLASALVFAGFHLDPVQMAGVLPIGIYLAWLRDRTGSLAIPIAAHVANNSIALVAARALPHVEVAGTADPTPLPLAAVFLSITVAAMAIVHRTSPPRA